MTAANPGEPAKTDAPATSPGNTPGNLPGRWVCAGIAKPLAGLAGLAGQVYGTVLGLWHPGDPPNRSDQTESTEPTGQEPDVGRKFAGVRTASARRDTDSEILLARQLSQQALHDLKTKLPNRQYFTTALERWLRQADPATGVTLYHLDIDGFSLINGSLGPMAGDDLLRHVARALSTVVAGEHTMVSRVGGDEFTILIDNSPTTPDVMTMIDRIHDALAEPIYIRRVGSSPSVCVGVVHRPPADMPPAEVFRAADLALRRAKARGRGQWALFDADQDEQDRQRLGLAAGMPGAWENGEVGVAYRPAVWLGDRRLAGVEATLCWRHPRQGVIGHDECVALAEETGLIMSLGSWLLRSACEQSMRGWGEGAAAVLPVAVALSHSQCTDPDLVSKVLRIVRECGLPPGRLRLGLPARAFDEHRDEAADTGRLLAAAGISVILRDFGSTVDDLACLEDFPVSAVRLAPALVARLARHLAAGTEIADESVVATAARDLVAIARLAGARVLVGEIETEDQADWWYRAGCELGTGPLFATAQGFRPTPP